MCVSVCVCFVVVFLVVFGDAAHSMHRSGRQPDVDEREPAVEDGGFGGESCVYSDKDKHFFDSSSVLVCIGSTFRGLIGLVSVLLLKSVLCQDRLMGPDKG